MRSISIEKNMIAISRRIKMGDMKEVFNAMRESDKERRWNNLVKAKNHTSLYHEGCKILETTPEGVKVHVKFLSLFTKHTIWHYSTVLDGDRLDYWPTKNKWRWRDKNYVGAPHQMEGFLKKRGWYDDI